MGPERRTTRKQQKQLEEALKSEQLPATDAKDDAGDLYIVPPARAEACLSKETMLAVEEKA